jgi:outer membrane lipoprotein carrier protein
MKRLIYRRLGCLILLLLPCSVLAEPHDDLAELMNYLSPIKTLTGDFRQQTLDARQQSLQILSGQFSLMREGPKLIWQTASPDDQILRVRDETLWTIDLALEQLVIQDLGEMLEQSPALLLTGERADIALRYEVELLELTDMESHFALTPRDPSTPVERIEMHFNQGLPERLQLVDSFQQTTLVVFQNLQVNEPLLEELFEFEVPAHFDVIDQRAQ